MRASKRPDKVLLSVPAFLLADDRDLLAVQAGQAGNDRLVVAETPVAVKFDEIF
jgi:hypothetical protein